MTSVLYKLGAELLVTATALGVAFVAGHLGGVKSGRMQVEQQWAAERAQMFQQAASAAQAAREVAQHRAAAAQEIAHDAENAASAARADAAAAGAAADRLRARAAQLAARCGGAASADPASAAGSAPAAAPGLVLADMFGRADDTAGELATALDRAVIAGRACERAYDALMP